MSFISNSSLGSNRISSYILTIVSIVFAYGVLGLIPLLIHLSILNRGESVAELSMSDIISILGENTVLVHMIIPFIIVLAVLFLAVRFWHGRKVLSVLTSREKFDWKRFFLSAGIWMTVLILFLGISMPFTSAIEWNFSPETFVPLLLISLLLLPLQTAAEDVLFRGYLLQGFHMMYKRAWISILASGILFGLLHVGNPEVEILGKGLLIYYIQTGIFLGVLTVFDDGLELSMGYHAANNIFAALILTSDWQAFQTDALLIDKSAPAFGLENVLTLIILQPLLLFLFSKIYKWKNLKEKLFASSESRN